MVEELEDIEKIDYSAIKDDAKPAEATPEVSAAPVTNISSAQP
jgi:hypothetical protein